VRVNNPARSIPRPLHWPLRRLALCLDCDECFELGHSSCPACSSRTWTTLARFLEIVTTERVARSAIRAADRPAVPEERAEGGQIPRHLLIVARDHVRLYEHLRRTFAANRSVRVLLDRRSRERRQGKEQPAAERRRSDRRARPSIDEQLRAIGWSLVLLDLAKNPRRMPR
jgi:hypothetical protein